MALVGSLVHNLKQQKLGTRLHEEMEWCDQRTPLLPNKLHHVVRERNVSVCHTLSICAWPTGPTAKAQRKSTMIKLPNRFASLWCSIPGPAALHHGTDPYAYTRATLSTNEGRQWQEGPVTPCTAILPIHIVLLSENRLSDYSLNPSQCFFLAAFQ